MSPDFNERLLTFNEHGVEYLIVGVLPPQERREAFQLLAQPLKHLTLPYGRVSVSLLTACCSPLTVLSNPSHRRASAARLSFSLP
ncbi:MAG TPA: hypothetical protein VLH87_06425, partial [Pyrinomonadaceae bacterium]|nr:hypothetical protein [Pyrinomonadaceae bacterium]